jgi:protein-disulfide isomerase
MANPSPNSSVQRLTLITLVAVALIAVGLIVYFQLAPQQSQNQGSASGDLELSNQPMLGDENAPVEIAVFEDFKCPACQFFDAEVMPQITRELIDTGQAKIYFLNFPFIGPDSTTAAIAGECVYNQDNAAFWEYKTYVFRSQGPESQEWATPATLAEIARANVPSIDADALQSCIEDETYAEQVTSDRDMGNSAGVGGTPTVFVNGTALESFEFATIQEAVTNAGN